MSISALRFQFCMPHRAIWRAANQACHLWNLYETAFAPGSIFNAAVSNYPATGNGEQSRILVRIRVKRATGR